jgi:hypothetical protein
MLRRTGQLCAYYFLVSKKPFRFSKPDQSPEVQHSRSFGFSRGWAVQAASDRREGACEVDTNRGMPKIGGRSEEDGDWRG